MQRIPHHVADRGALFYAVSRWNGIEDQIYYINTSSLYTVQMTLKQMIESIAISAEEGSTTQMTPENVKAASITLSMLPMLIRPSIIAVKNIQHNIWEQTRR